MMNELARDLSYAKEKVQYDTQCKQVLSQKEILAWILQRTVKEFTNMAVSDIIPSLKELLKFLQFQSIPEKPMQRKFPVCQTKIRFLMKEVYTMISDFTYMRL